MLARPRWNAHEDFAASHPERDRPPSAPIVEFRLRVRPWPLNRGGPGAGPRGSRRSRAKDLPGRNVGRNGFARKPLNIVRCVGALGLDEIAALTLAQLL